LKYKPYAQGLLKVCLRFLCMLKLFFSLKLFMEEVRLRVEIPGGMEKEVTQAFLEELEIAVARRILSKSELSEEKAGEIGEEIKEGIARRHGL